MRSRDVANEIGAIDPGIREALDRLRPDRKVYDLVRSMEEPDLSDDGDQGICW